MEVVQTMELTEVSEVAVVETLWPLALPLSMSVEAH